MPALRGLHEVCPEGGPAVYMPKQCTPLLVEKAGVAPDMTFRFTAQKQENHPGFETHGEGHTKSKIGAISGPTKWTLVQQNLKKKLIWYDTPGKLGRVARHLNRHNDEM